MPQTIENRGFIMKSYPSISTKIKQKRVVAFDKLDGSNIRAEWSNKNGFYKFGSRTRLIDENTPILGESINLIMENFADDLSAKFKNRHWTRAVAFFEFYGQNSFAGWHEPEEHKVTLIDVNIYKSGMLEPEMFVDVFGDLGIPKVLHHGMLTEELITETKKGTLDGMTFEGIVCKFKNKAKNVEMFKVKNKWWLYRLKNKCDGNEALFRRLR
jgi:hypothetical protein